MVRKTWFRHRFDVPTTCGSRSCATTGGRFGRQARHGAACPREPVRSLQESHPYLDSMALLGGLLPGSSHAGRAHGSVAVGRGAARRRGVAHPRAKPLKARPKAAKIRYPASPGGGRRLQACPRPRPRGRARLGQLRLHPEPAQHRDHGSHRHRASRISPVPS